jgi:hypothetical protein
LTPYLYPNVNLGFIAITGFGELLFPLWLVIRGWKIQEAWPEDARSTPEIGYGAG